MVAGRARPTMRCLCEDLVLPVPRVDTPLDEITHPLLTKASERFADDQTPRERISAIDDQVLFKVKIQRWRGAVWVDADLPWLVAAGQREEGSPDDFYAALAARGHSARAHYNAEHSPPLRSTTDSGYLLPGHEDDLRWQAEAAARTERRTPKLARGQPQAWALVCPFSSCFRRPRRWCRRRVNPVPVPAAENGPPPLIVGSDQCDRRRAGRPSSSERGLPLGLQLDY
jgi:hypothetical protein